MLQTVRYRGCSSVGVCTLVPIVPFRLSRTHIAIRSLPMSLHYCDTKSHAIYIYPLYAVWIIAPLCVSSFGCYTDSSHLLWDYIAFHRCTMCFKKGHQPISIALNPRLFKKNIIKGGFYFTKKPRAKMSYLSYVCLLSRQPRILKIAAQRSRATCEAENEKLEMDPRRQNGLVANLASDSAPRTDILDTLVGLGSPASTVSAASVVAGTEQALCADAGLDTVASAWVGAVTSVSGVPSGVASIDSPCTALAILSSRRAEAERKSAKRLRNDAFALEAPQESRRLYVSFVPRSLLLYLLSMRAWCFVFLSPLLFMLLTLFTHRKHPLFCCNCCLCFCSRSQRVAECAPIPCGRCRHLTGSRARGSFSTGPV